jgi:hypothetical protein
MIMDKQIINIKLLANGDIQFKTNRKETPYNRVISLNAEYVETVVNGKHLTYLDTEDYFKYALWANPLAMEHGDIRKGVVAVENGYSHKSVAALVMQTKPGQRVGYRDGNRFNLRKSNLYIIGEPDDTYIEDLI